MYSGALEHPHKDQLCKSTHVVANHGALVYILMHVRGQEDWSLLAEVLGVTAGGAV